MRCTQRGNGLLLVIMVFAVLFAVVGLSLEQNSAMATQIYKHHLETAALNLAESGIAYAIEKMRASDNFYGEENLQLAGSGTCTVSITQLTPSNKIEVLTTGRAFSTGPHVPNAVKTIRMVLQRNEDRPDQPFTVLSKEFVS